MLGLGKDWVFFVFGKKHRNSKQTMANQILMPRDSTRNRIHVKSNTAAVTEYHKDYLFYSTCSMF